MIRECHDPASTWSRRTLLGTATALAAGNRWGRQATAARQPAGWTQLAGDRAGPVARWDHTLAADDARQRMILFGGRDGSAQALGDTWVFELAEQTWRRLDVAGPSPRFGQAMAADQAAGVLYLFGGQDNAPTFFDDAWRYELATDEWSEIDTGDGPRPAARYGTSAVLDDAGALLISHGFTFEGRFDDTWSLDLASGVWTDRSPAAETRPLKRCLHEAVWDVTGARMVLFGGCSSGFGPCPQGDWWAFDPAEGTWSELTTAGGPAARSNPALVGDPDGERALLVGGLTDGGHVLDLWSLPLGGGAAQGWEALAVAGQGPSPRASHDATISDGALYLFGGSSGTGAMADLWRLKLRAG
jgi:hypothetical protein